jgi:hypothetical protein
MDADGHEYVVVPKGLCEKLVNGSLKPFENEEKEG